MKPLRELGAIGVEVADMDLSDLETANQRELITNAYHENAVLLFRHQYLTPQAQIHLTRLFGEVHPHPLPSHRGPPAHPELMIVEQGPGMRTRRNDIWHSDVSFAEHPPSATVLHAIEVPEGLGDTLFCNMVRAHDQLSDGMKVALSGLRCMHSAAAENEQVRRQQKLECPVTGPDPMAHPVVRTHQESGQTSLYINPHYVTHIENFTVEESAPLLNYLYRSALHPENIYRHQWQVGDVLVWDNSRTLHYAVRDYDDNTVRIMHRTTAQKLYTAQRPV